MKWSFSFIFIFLLLFWPQNEISLFKSKGRSPSSETTFEQAKIVEGPLAFSYPSTGASTAKIVLLENGVTAIVKQDGRHKRVAQKEIFSYQLSHYLELALVPLTVERTIEGQLWSMQLFIQADLAKNSTRQPLEEEVQKLNLFDFLLGNGDRHQDNYMITSEGKIWAIDNSGLVDTEVFSEKLKSNNLWNLDIFGQWIEGKKPPSNFRSALSDNEYRQLIERFQFVQDLYRWEINNYSEDLFDKLLQFSKRHYVGIGPLFHKVAKLKGTKKEYFVKKIFLESKRAPISVFLKEHPFLIEANSCQLILDGLL